MCSFNRMLINAAHPEEEIRFAVMHGNYLTNLYIEKPGSEKKSNVYKAVITRVEKSLQAAFINFGAERHGFLPFKEISPEYYQGDFHNMANSLREGQEIMVQVEKEERGNKGAALTTFISLPGSYLVLMPNNPKAGGISRQIAGDERDELKDILHNLKIPNHMGVIIRTAGVGKSLAELQWDLDILLRLWDAISHAYEQRPGPFLIHQESDIIAKAVRDYIRDEINEILIDNDEVFERTKDHLEQVRPEFSNRLKHYQDNLPLFSKFQIENQIETAFESEVRLPSGGSIVIEQTEAMVAIDVNSSKDTKGGHIEDTAFNTNTEAAIEVARQLRLRDLGGLIVVDFIDMLSSDNQRDIVNTFYDAIQSDKARVQFGRISKFGLLEISRQRLRPSLSESSQIVCPRCSGNGTIRSNESLAMLLIRLLHEDAVQPNIVGLDVQVPVSVASYLFNEKREALLSMEQQSNVTIRIIPNPYMESPAYNINRIFRKQGRNTSKQPSYELITQPEPEVVTSLSEPAQAAPEQAAVKLKALERPADLEQKPESLIRRLWRGFTSAARLKEDQESEQEEHGSHKHKHPSRKSSRRSQHRHQSKKNRHQSPKPHKKPRGKKHEQQHGRQQQHGQQQHQESNSQQQKQEISNQQKQKFDKRQKQSKKPRHQESQQPSAEENLFDTEQENFFTQKSFAPSIESVDIFAEPTSDKKTSTHQKQVKQPQKSDKDDKSGSGNRKANQPQFIGANEPTDTINLFDNITKPEIPENAPLEVNVAPEPKKSIEPAAPEPTSTPEPTTEEPIIIIPEPIPAEPVATTPEPVVEAVEAPAEPEDSLVVISTSEDKPVTMKRPRTRSKASSKQRRRRPAKIKIATETKPLGSAPQQTKPKPTEELDIFSSIDTSNQKED